MCFFRLIDAFGSRIALALVAALMISEASLGLAQENVARISTPPPKTRIVGGERADLDQWGFYALIGSKHSDNQINFSCGGSVVSSQWVLTAAHCVVDEDRLRSGASLNAAAADPRSLRILIGEGTISSADEDNVFEVESVEIHRGYTPVTEDGLRALNDIALLRLTRPWSGPVAELALRSTDDPTGGLTQAAGFGLTERASIRVQPTQRGVMASAGSSRLLAVALPIVQTQKCLGSLAGFGKVDAKRQICAGWESGRDTCNGDSGGPLIAFDDQQAPFQIGLVSWGSRSCGTKGVPAVYTRISAYADWLSARVPDLVDRGPRYDLQDIIAEYPNAIGQLRDALADAPAPVSIAICEANARTRCGNSWRAGDEIVLVIESSQNGKLVLLQEDALGNVTQLIPNSLSSAMSHAQLSKDVPVVFPPDDSGLVITITGPFGRASLLGVVIPEGADISAVLASDKALTRSLVSAYPAGSFDALEFVGEVAREIVSTLSEELQTDESWGMEFVEYAIRP